MCIGVDWSRCRCLLSQRGKYRSKSQLKTNLLGDFAGKTIYPPGAYLIRSSVIVHSSMGSLPPRYIRSGVTGWARMNVRVGSRGGSSMGYVHPRSRTLKRYIIDRNRWAWPRGPYNMSPKETCVRVTTTPRRLHNPLVRLVPLTTSPPGARDNKSLLKISRWFKPIAPNTQNHVIILNTQRPDLESQLQHKYQIQTIHTP